MKKILSFLVLLFLVGCTNETVPLVGGDRDEHGCIPSAGYSWCEAKQKCIRIWEEPCETLQEKAAKFCEDENVDSVYICGERIHVVSSLLGGGSTYYLADGSQVSCPVVGPDYISEECKQIMAEECEEEQVC
ncbi:hypothetical protein JXB11_02970 [Candidatus Woesearchaeota archaeon]|nr:hypothetical protein [Candidatus Woesearchaeota archaeon]